jgi:hypothetical protein
MANAAVIAAAEDPKIKDARTRELVRQAGANDDFDFPQQGD